MRKLWPQHIYITIFSILEWLSHIIDIIIGMIIINLLPSIRKSWKGANPKLIFSILFTVEQNSPLAVFAPEKRSLSLIYWFSFGAENNFQSPVFLRCVYSIQISFVFSKICYFFVQIVNTRQLFYQYSVYQCRSTFPPLKIYLKAWRATTPTYVSTFSIPAQWRVVKDLSSPPQRLLFAKKCKWIWRFRF